MSRRLHHPRVFQSLEARLMLDATLVKDIDANTRNSSPSAFTQVGNALFFAADSDPASRGNELWRTDGTDLGTHRIGEELNLSWVDHLVEHDDGLHFTTNANRELWRTDGTEDGTLLLYDVRDVPAVDGHFEQIYFTLHAATKSYFVVAGHAATAYEIWETDGTTEGTLQTARLSKLANRSLVRESFHVVGDRLFVREFISFDEQRLHVVEDGQVRQLFEGLTIGPMTGFGDELVFASTARSGNSLLVTEGGGSRLLSKDLLPITEIRTSETEIYFTRVSAEELTFQVFLHDGNSEREIHADTIVHASRFGQAPALSVARARNELFFTFARGRATEIWRYQVGREAAGWIQTIPNAWLSVKPFGNDVIVSSGVQSYVNDGFGQFKSIDEFYEISDASRFRHVVSWNENVVFSARDGNDDVEPWIVGPSTTARRIHDVNKLGRYANIRMLVATEQAIGFAASDEVWTSDGTENGTQPILEDPLNDVVVLGANQNDLFVAHLDEDGQHHISIIDSSSKQSIEVIALGPSIDDFDVFYQPLQRHQNFDNKLFFTTVDRLPFEPKLWWTDGSTVQPFEVDGMDADVRMWVFGEELYFVTSSEIWKSDGTPTGTRRIAAFDTYVTSIHKTGDRLYVMSRELDVAFVYLIENDKQQSTAKLPAAREHVALVGDRLVFTSQFPVAQPLDLWSSDGTTSGTNRIATFAGVSVEFIVTVGETLLFTVDDGVHGRELWSTDGTSAGTQLIKDVAPGADSGFQTRFSFRANQVAVYDGHAYFFDNNPNGVSLWQSDGTLDGTRRAVDRTFVRASEVIVQNDELFFVADDGVHGGELWRLPLIPAPNPGDANGDGIVNFQDFLIISANFGMDVASREMGDLDASGKVDFQDFLLLRANYNP